MDKQNETCSYQQIGNGIYRVHGAVKRNPRTGKYVFNDTDKDSLGGSCACGNNTCRCCDTDMS